MVYFWHEWNIKKLRNIGATLIIWFEVVDTKCLQLTADSNIKYGISLSYWSPIWCWDLKQTPVIDCDLFILFKIMQIVKTQLLCVFHKLSTLVHENNHTYQEVIFTLYLTHLYSLSTCKNVWFSPQTMLHNSI